MRGRALRMASPSIRETEAGVSSREASIRVDVITMAGSVSTAAGGASTFAWSGAAWLAAAGCTPNTQAPHATQNVGTVFFGNNVFLLLSGVSGAGRCPRSGRSPLRGSIMPLAHGYLIHADCLHHFRPDAHAGHLAASWSEHWLERHWRRPGRPPGGRGRTRRPAGGLVRGMECD